MSRLPDGEFRAQIEGFISMRGISVRDIFIEKSNAGKGRAYFCGMGSSRSIVVSDCLTHDVQTEELLGVISHEIGHFLHHDIEKTLAYRSVKGLLFILLVWIMISDKGLFHLNDVLTIILMIPFAIPFKMFENVVSRHQERRADDYVIMCGLGGSFASYLGRLKNDDPNNDPNKFIYLLFRTHPLLKDRIEYLKKCQE